MPGRIYNGANYRYGFNGKENDNEIKGTGNQQDYGLRIYDNRLGKFLSVDPLYKEFAWNSTYSFAENDVVRSIDLDGSEKDVVIHVYDPSNPDRKATTFQLAMKYSVLFPCKEYGPGGKTGTLHIVYDIVAKKIQQRTYKSENLKAFEDNIYYKNSKIIKVTEIGSGGTPEVKVFDPYTGNTNPTVSNKGDPASYDEKTDYTPDYIEKNKDGSQMNTYNDKKGNPAVSVGIDPNGDTMDVYKWNPDGGFGEHNYPQDKDKLGSGYKENLRRIPNLKKDNPK